MSADREHAPMLRIVWGDLAAQVATLVREHPILARRLMFSPRRAMHSYAVALHEVDDTETTLDLARRLEATHPRTLLAQALPGCSTRLYNLLDRCGDSARPAAFYRDIHALLLGPRAGLLEGAESIEDATMSFLAALDDLDPLVAQVAPGLAWSVQRARAVDDMLRLLRDQGIVVDETTTGITSPVGSKAFRRHIRRHYDALAMPHPGFEAPPGLRFAGTIGEVRALGRAFKNCLTEFGKSYDCQWPEFIAGSRVYLRGDQPKVVVCLRRLGCRTWWIEQAVGPSNAALPADVRRQIEQGFSAVGVQLLHSDPHRCLRQLLDAHATMGLDDDDEEDAVDLAA